MAKINPVCHTHTIKCSHRYSVCLSCEFGNRMAVSFISGPSLRALSRFTSDFSSLIFGDHVRCIFSLSSSTLTSVCSCHCCYLFVLLLLLRLLKQTTHLAALLLLLFLLLLSMLQRVLEQTAFLTVLLFILSFSIVVFFCSVLLCFVSAVLPICHWYEETSLSTAENSISDSHRLPLF